MAVSCALERGEEKKTKAERYGDLPLFLDSFEDQSLSMAMMEASVGVMK